VAEVWMSAPPDADFRFAQGNIAAALDRMFVALANGSGYAEVVWAPLIHLGHPAAAS
jgi:hypothetical protein